MYVKSKYSFRFMGWIAFFLSIEILFFTFLYSLLNNMSLLVSNIMYQLVALLIIVLIYLIARWILKFYKTIPSVTITDTEIILDYLVGHKRISIDDVCEFNLTDSFPASEWILMGSEVNGFSIRTKADEEYIFYEKCYRNSHELRARFTQIINMDFIPIEETHGRASLHDGRASLRLPLK